MSKFIKILGAAIIILLLIYFIGPTPPKANINPKVSELNIDIQDLDAYIRKHETETEFLKKGNEANIIWADKKFEKTPYSIVYLHGYSASHQEGDPVHKNIAKHFGANLYLTRLSKHGLVNGEALKGISVENYLESAKQALAIGQIIGDSVIIVSTSTGGTLGLLMAAHNDKIAALVCYSPNIRVANPSAFLLNNPWGREIAVAVLGGDQYEWSDTDSVMKYWSTSYPLDALISMQELLESTMIESTFKKINQPLFMGYFYKNEEEQDKVVRVDKMLEMFEQISTPENKKMKVAFPESGHHVIASRHKSKDFKNVEKETIKFLEKVIRVNKE